MIEAERALARGRCEEALDLASHASVREHRRAEEVRREAARLLVERARDRAERGELTAAFADLRRASGEASDEIARELQADLERRRRDRAIREAEEREALAEAERLLRERRPRSARERLLGLRSARGEARRLLGEVEGRLARADRLLDEVPPLLERGEAEAARVRLAEAADLAPDHAALDGLRRALATVEAEEDLRQARDGAIAGEVERPYRFVAGHAAAHPFLLDTEEAVAVTRAFRRALEERLDGHFEEGEFRSAAAISRRLSLAIGGAVPPGVRARAAPLAARAEEALDRGDPARAEGDLASAAEIATNPAVVALLRRAREARERLEERLVEADRALAKGDAALAERGLRLAAAIAPGSLRLRGRLGLLEVVRGGGDPGTSLRAGAYGVAKGTLAPATGEAADETVGTAIRALDEVWRASERSLGRAVAAASDATTVEAARREIEARADACPGEPAVAGAREKVLALEEAAREFRRGRSACDLGEGEVAAVAFATAVDRVRSLGELEAAEDLRAEAAGALLGALEGGLRAGQRVCVGRALRREETSALARGLGDERLAGLRDAVLGAEAGRSRPSGVRPRSPNESVTPGSDRVPPRFALRIEEGGDYLVFRGDRVRLGHAREEGNDLPLLARVASAHAEIVRRIDLHEGVVYEVVPLARRAVTVSGVRISGPVRLRDGDEIRLGETWTMRFRLPSPRSRSALLLFPRGFEVLGARGAVLLKGGRDGRILLGAPDAHLAPAEGTTEIEVFLERGGRLHCRCEEGLRLDGRPAGREAALRSHERVEAGTIRFAAAFE